MKPQIRTVIELALHRWGCLWQEEIRNLLRVEIEPDSPPANIFLAHGTVHLALVELEEDVLASFREWRMLTPGSYYFHRLLEHLRSGPPVGQTIVQGKHPGPRPEQLMPQGRQISPDCWFTGKTASQEIQIVAVSYHFAVRLLGIEPLSEIITTTIEAFHGNQLPQLVADDLLLGAVTGPAVKVSVESTFPAAVEALRQRLDGLIEAYAAGRARETRRTLRRLRAAWEADLQAVVHLEDKAELLRRQVELDELWSLREREVLLRAGAERAEVSLVAATVEHRPALLYSAELALPEARFRFLHRIFDRASGWLEPLRCEACHATTDLLIPGKVPCNHLLCESCWSGGILVCGHKICGRCRQSCQACARSVCPVCAPKCSRCLASSCDRHSQRCSVCNGRLCPQCHPRCLSCKSYFCEQHGIECPVCDRVICAQHTRHKGTCYERWLRQRLLELNGPSALFVTTAETWFQPLGLRKRDYGRVKDYIKNSLDSLPQFTEDTSESYQLNVDYSSDIFSRRQSLSFDDMNMEQYQHAAIDPFLQEYGMIPQIVPLTESLEFEEATEMLQRGWFEQEVHSDPTIDLVPFWDAGSIETLWEANPGWGAYSIETLWEEDLDFIDMPVEDEEEIAEHFEVSIAEGPPVRRAEIDWISGPWPGRLGIVPRPRGGDWLADEVRSWRASGVGVVVSLLTPDEIAELQLQDEATCSRGAGLDFYEFPIPDCDVPESREDWAKLINHLAIALRSGQFVAVHCRQSIGRSSLVVASLLAIAGQELDMAFRHIERIYGKPVPDTTEQRDWVAQMTPKTSATRIGQRRGLVGGVG